MHNAINPTGSLEDHFIITVPHCNNLSPSFIFESLSLILTLYIYAINYEV